MSVRDEITRLETAKSDIEAAIETCGVNVPDTEKISAYASYIRQIPSAVFSELNADKVGGADQFIQTIEQVDGVIEATAGGLVSSSLSGLTPKIGTAAAATIGTQSDEWVLTSTKGAQPTWRKLPANAFKNDNSNTTYTLSGALSNNTFVSTLTPSSGNATTSTVPALSGASSSAAGKAGLVPAPAKGDEGKFLRGDGTWKTPTASENSYYLYTQYQNSTDFYSNYKAYLKWIANDVAAFHFTDGTYKFKADLAGSADSVAWTNVTGRPTKLSDFTDDVVSGKYLPLTGGRLTGNLTLYAASGNSPYIKFLRGSDKTDTLCDWTIVDEGGYLIFREGISGATEDVLKICGSANSSTFTGSVAADSFVGPLTGNADTSTYATYLGTSSSNYSKSTLDSALADRYSYSTSRTKNTVLAAPNGSNGSATFRALVAADLPAHNHNSSQITALTSYSKATSVADVLTTDSLNTALGKLEYKADLGKTAYDIVSAANDSDGTIENLKEILDVLSGISDTDTIQAIVGKYLPLAGGTVSGTITLNATPGIIVNRSSGVPYIRFGKNSSSIYGEFGADSTGTPVWWTDVADAPGKGAWKAILTESNFIKWAAKASHTHTVSDIEDFPTIPTVPNYTLRASSTIGKFYLQKDGSDHSNITINLPSLSGGSEAETGKYVSGVTVSGHTITVNKESLPVSLKNPNAIKFKKTDGTSVSYDGSSAVDLEAGINYATHSASASTLSGGSIASWGTLTGTNGYTNVCTWDTGNTTGAFSLAGKGGQMSMQLDGFFYQNEGQYLVLDTNNYTTYVNETNYPGLNKTGTVTSVTVTGANGLSGTGTITSSGTITLSNAGVRSLTVGTGDNATKLAVNTGGTTSYLTVPFATKTSSLHYANIGGGSSDTHDSVLKTYFNSNKTSIPRNSLLGMYSGAYGNGSYYMGYFLSGYDSGPYGGFFVAHYGNPYYVGISNGSYNTQHILTSTNYTSYVNETNFPGLNKTGTVTSVKVGGTSYSPSSGVISLPAYPTDTNYYHTRVYSSGLKISTGTGVNDMYVPTGTTSSLGVVKQHTAANCTSYTSDEGATTPAAVKKAVGLFAVTKVSTGTGLTGGDITSTGTISINSTYQTYIANGNTAYGWGNHANAGYISGITKDDVIAALGYTPYSTTNPNGYTANTGDITGVTAGNGLTGGSTSGTATLNVGAGTGISVTADAVGISSAYQTKISNGDTAYGWGNHADMGYLDKHQTIHSLTIKNSGGTTQLTYTPNSVEGSITLTKAMVGLGNVDNTADADKTVAVANKLGTVTKGSVTKPIYLSLGTATECNTYAGGTLVNLNGSSKASDTARFYAPTAVGTSEYLLKSNGSGAPTWTHTIGSSTTSLTASYITSMYADALYLKSYYPTSGDIYISGFTTVPDSSSRVRLYTARYALIKNNSNSSTCAIYAPGGFYESSDERLKHLLNPLQVNLDDIGKLRKIYYTWKDDTNSGRQLGVVAQDVQKLYPELVDVHEDTGYLSLAYDKLSVIALGAIDKLYDIFKRLSLENEELKNRLENLEKLV